jgi:hypothetical protein
MKNLLIGLLIIFAFIGGYFLSQKYNFKLEPRTQVQIVISPTTQPLVGNDVDAHGCKGSAGYSWCEQKQKCLRIFEEKCEIQSPTPTIDETESLKATIKQLLVQKHGSTANELTVTVSQMAGDYARGGASSSGGGGMWLAKRVNSSWNLIFDGNGAPDCLILENQYQFPKSMLQGICD